jgi:hypothetical protein
MIGFWEKGALNYGKALHTDYKAQTEALEAKLRQCQNPDERVKLTVELEALKKDFQNKLRQCGRSLF